MPQPDQEKVPAISDERQQWMCGPRQGLLTHEFAEVIGVDARSIRDEIRNGRLPGNRLEAYGYIFAYCATVDDVASFYELQADVADVLRTRLNVDIFDESPMMGQLENYSNVSWNVCTEFETPDEFHKENPKDA